MSQQNGRLSITGMIAGGFLLGAGAFGLFRGLNAEPLPDPILPPVKAELPAVPSGGDTLPLPAMATLPPPTLPAVPPHTITTALPTLSAPALPSSTLPTLPAVEAASGIVPPVVPPGMGIDPKESAKPRPAVPDLPTLPSPGSTPAVTLPAPAPVKSPLDAIPLPNPSLDSVPPVTGSINPPPVPVPAPTPEPAVKTATPASLPSLPAPAPVSPVNPTPAAVLPAPVEAPSPAKSDFNLRPEQPGLNVNPRGAGSTAVELPPPQEVRPEPLPAPRKFGDELTPAPRPLVEPPAIPQPTLPSPAPGDAPMPILSKQMLLSAAMGVALAATPAAPVIAADDPKPMTPEQKIEAMQKAIDDLVKDMKVMKEKKDQLELQLYGRTDGKTALTPTELGVLKRLENAEADLKKTKELVKDLETKLATQTTVAKTPLPTALAGKGKVVLVNEFKTKLSIMVNGKSYPLDVNETKEVLVGEGEFTYELVEFPNASPVKSTIKEAETVTLRIK